MAAGTQTGGVIVNFKLKVAGVPVPDNLNIYAVHVEKQVNRIAHAKIVVLDGDPNTGEFDVSSSALFVPGAQISIEAGYDGDYKMIFKGIITGQRLRINPDMGSKLEVECRDEAIKMTGARKSHTYADQSDSEIIQSIIGTYAGLSAKVSATNTVWPAQVQYYVTDWDYMLALAEANGLIITTINGLVSVVAPAENTNPVIDVSYGDNLMDFNARLNAVNQYSQVKASAWDYKNQVVISGDAMAGIAGPGNLSSKKLSDLIGHAGYSLQTTASLGTADLKNWSKAQMVKTEFSKILGEAKFQGTSLVEPATYISLHGLGDRFTGDYFVSGVVHEISDGNWITEVSLGISPVWFTEEKDIMAPPASGLLPGAPGLLNGTVKKVVDDPESQYRILVDIPMFDESGAGIWARLTGFYATSGAGAFFLPEVGDEVVVGFLNEDPRYPVILGSMYSSSKIKPYPGLDPNEKNQLKAIVSRSGISIVFDDVDKTLSICTPDKNTMVFNDKDKTIAVTDYNGNSLLMSAAGISIKSPKDINIESDQKINIRGILGVNIQSSGGDIDVQGINIHETADIQYSAAGAATALISSGAELTLKSAMILIN